MEIIWLVLILIGIALLRSSNQKRRNSDAAPRAPRPAPVEDEPELADEDEQFEKEFGPESSLLPSEGDIEAAEASQPPEPETQAGDTQRENTHSDEGESDAEHAEHLRKIAQAEARCRAGREAEAARIAQDRQRLRDAIVMREVLDKPVALRARRR